MPSPIHLADAANSMLAENTKVFIDLPDGLLDKIHGQIEKCRHMPQGSIGRLLLAEGILAFGVFLDKKYGGGKGHLRKYLQEVLSDVPSEIAKRIIANSVQKQSIIKT